MTSKTAQYEPPLISLKNTTPVDSVAVVNFHSMITTIAAKLVEQGFNYQKPVALVDDQAISFTAVLAHEVRNPLTNISLSISMLEQELKDTDMNLYLDIIKRSTARINNLMNELLAQQEAATVEAQNHSVHEMLDEVLEMAEDRILLKKIKVFKDFAALDCVMLMDKPKMKIALTNMIINAIDAMEYGKGELRLYTKSVDGGYILQIQDNGCGISKRNLKHIFIPYFTQKPGGPGIGLSAAYDILRSNHIGVCVQSAEGLGTRFMLLFKKNIQTKLSADTKWIEPSL